MTTRPTTQPRELANGHAGEARVRVLQTKRQTGSAFIPRKTAIEAAGSGLICCVDADDRIAPDFMERLMRRRLETGADIVYPSMWRFDNTTSQRLLPHDTGLYDKTIAGRDVVRLTLYGWKINTNGALKDRRLYLSLYERMPHFAKPYVCRRIADALSYI